jgi:hypothetical protein
VLLEAAVADGVYRINREHTDMISSEDLHDTESSCTANSR